MRVTETQRSPPQKSIFDVQLPAKLGRSDLTGTALATSAFNPKPSSPTEPRLRVTVVARTDPSWDDAQEGAFNFGRGLAQGIRNLFAHGLHEPDEQDALEQLAALSLFARWIAGSVRVDNGT
jgi:hypothetical protein